MTTRVFSPQSVKEPVVHSPCSLCFDEDSVSYLVCNGGHFSCGDCIPRIFENYSSEITSGCSGKNKLFCPGGCKEGADVARLVVAIGVAGPAKESASVMARLFATAATAAEISGEPHGRVECARDRREKALVEVYAGTEAVTSTRLIQDALIDRCPSCDVAFDEWEACNHVTCTKCAAEFCGVCRNLGTSCYVKCSGGDIYDRASVQRARSERLTNMVRRELSNLSDRVRQSVVDHIADTLLGLGMKEIAQVSSSVNVPVSQNIMMGRIKRMLSEMNALYTHFKSGSGYFERLDRNHESITVRKAHFHQRAQEGEFVVHCSPFPGESSTDCTAREELLKRNTNTAFFAKKLRENRVHFIQRENGRISPPQAFENGAKLDCYIDFGREQRTIDSLQAVRTSRGSTLSPAMQALLGGVKNAPVLAAGAVKCAEARRHLDSFSDSVKLNEEQQRAIDVTSARLVLPIFGPPGTGKTTVIAELLKAPVCDGLWLTGAYRRHVVIICSEKNLAVDAVADKLLKAGGRNPEHPVWLETVAHGVHSSLGDNAARFLLTNKVPNAKEVVAAEVKLKEAEAIRKDLTSKLARRNKLHAPVIASIVHESVVSDIEDNAHFSSSSRSRGKIALAEVLRRRWNAKLTAEAAFQCAEFASFNEKVVTAHKEIYSVFEKLREAERYEERCHSNVASSKDEAKTRLKLAARVVLVTLGSSHGIANTLGQEITKLELDDDEHKDPISATVICDEASTVQSALFVGAMVSFQLKITNIIVVGDDRQLEPYWPISPGNGSNVPVIQPGSLFDDALDIAKYSAINLREQYRMPREIMRLVNRFFYSDRPLTFGKPEVESQSSPVLQWVNVPTCRSFQRSPVGGARREAEKRNETSPAESMEVAFHARSAKDSGCSVLVMTPYRQQRDLLKQDLGIGGKVSQRSRAPGVSQVDSNSDGSLSVCTVDGAQGQEADVVIVSMMKNNPTRFLNKKRLCVMLSRAKVRMVIVGDHAGHMNCRNDVIKYLASICSVTAAATG